MEWHRPVRRYTDARAIHQLTKGISSVFSFSTVSNARLTTEQWFYIFQEPWCFTLITIKCSIGFALIRISTSKKWLEWVIYACMILCLIVMGGTGVYLFFQCTPIQ